MQLPEVRRRAIEYSAYTSNRHASHSWVAISAHERFHWLSMASKLAVAASTLTKGFWLEAALVIEDELLSILFGNRKFFGAADGHGVDLVTRDALVDGLKHHRHYLEALDQWLAENSASGDAAGVVQLRQTIRVSLESSVHRNPFDASTSGRLVEVLMNAGFDKATALMAKSQIDISIDRNEQVAPLWQSLMAQLADNSHYSQGGNQRHCSNTCVRFCYVSLNIERTRGLVLTQQVNMYSVGSTPCRWNTTFSWISFVFLQAATYLRSELRLEMLAEVDPTSRLSSELCGQSLKSKRMEVSQTTLL
jgi:hypothetical protein